MEQALGMAGTVRDNDVDFESVNGTIRKSESVFQSFAKNSKNSFTQACDMNEKIDKTLVRLERKNQIL